jgi:hypothetical protein
LCSLCLLHVTTLSAPVTTYEIHVADGRRLAVNLSGDPLGEPVFYLHGTPGSRVGPRPTDGELMKPAVLSGPTSEMERVWVS